MSLSLSNDLNEVLTAFYEHVKEHSRLKTKLRENEKFINMLKLEIAESNKAEKRASSNLKRVQENVLQLQEITSNLATVKEENVKLKKDITNLQNLLEKEKKNYVLCEEKWTNDKEVILKSNKEELENMKTIRNMEAISLNREISRIQEENNKKIEDLKRGFQKLENEYKRNLSQTIEEYEEKLLTMNRDLIAANNEVKNLRQLTNNEMTYTIDLGQPKSDRNIPQPMSFVRYKPLPIIATASQIYSTEFSEVSRIEKTTSENQQSETKSDSKKSSSKKRKLYSRADDSFSY